MVSRLGLWGDSGRPFCLVNLKNVFVGYAKSKR